MKEVEEKEEEKKEGGFEKERRLREEGEDQKKSEGMKVAEAAQIIKLITLAAAISSAKAVENEKVKEDEKISFETMVACYTFFVVLATLFAQQIWKVGVRLVRAAAQRRQVPSPGSLPGEAKRGEKTSKGSVVSSHGERSVVAAPL